MLFGRLQGHHRACRFSYDESTLVHSCSSSTIDSNNRELQNKKGGVPTRSTRRQCGQPAAHTAVPPAPDAVVPLRRGPRRRRRSCTAARGFHRQLPRKEQPGCERTTNSQKSSRSRLTTLAHASHVCTSFPLPIPPCLRSSTLPTSTLSGSDVRPAPLAGTPPSSLPSWLRLRSKPTSCASDSCRRIAAASSAPRLSSASLMWRGADAWEARPGGSTWEVVDSKTVGRGGTRGSLLGEGCAWSERQERSRRFP